MTTLKHNVKIIWRQLPDDSKIKLLRWLEKQQNIANNPYHVTFYRNGSAISQVRALLSARTIANIREHTNAIAVISI